MQVTEVRIKLMEGSEDRLRAFCSITLDHCFVVRDLKIIEGTNGPFVAMPSRKLSGHCYRCNYKNHLRAAYCNQCGAKLKVTVAADSPQKLYADVAHPVNSECRELISAAVLAEFEHELARAAQPGYRSRYDDDFDAIAESHDDRFPVAEPPSERSPVAAPAPDSAAAQQPPTPADETGTDAEAPILRVDSSEQPQPKFGGRPAPSAYLDVHEPPEHSASDSSEPPRRRASGSGSFGEGIFE